MVNYFKWTSGQLEVNLSLSEEEEGRRLRPKGRGSRSTEDDGIRDINSYVKSGGNVNKEEERKRVLLPLPKKHNNPFNHSFTMMASGKTKRRRTESPHQCNPHLCNLPDNILVDVAEYLAKPSRAMFAVAMTAPSSSWRKLFIEGMHPPTTATSANNVILSPMGPWEELDFADIGFSLALKLYDDDIYAILMAINAANNLAKLKLAGCINVVGYGLEPLRGSTVLKQIDLSLLKENERVQYTLSSISKTAVLPILNSIVDEDDNSLRHFQLPEKMFGGKSPNCDSFLRRYNSIMEGKRLKCSKCHSILDDFILFECGCSDKTCYRCLQYFCGCHSEDGETYMKCCSMCGKNYCKDCVQISSCDNCDQNVCPNCAKARQCMDCGRHMAGVCVDCCQNRCACWNGFLCGDCAPTVLDCQDCNETNCNRCVGEAPQDVKPCHKCQKVMCPDCRRFNCRQDMQNACTVCLDMYSTAIMIGKLQEDNEQKGREIEELRQEIQEMRQEINMLHSLHKDREG